MLRAIAARHRALPARVHESLEPTIRCPRRPPGAAALSTSTPRRLKQLPPRPKPPPEEDIEEDFLKGSGPGGQKINKTSSAVQLRHKPTGVVVKSQATRSRIQNRKIAREVLATKLDEMQNGAQSRSAIVGVLKKKRADSAAKKARRKYKKLGLANEKEQGVGPPASNGDASKPSRLEYSQSGNPATT